MTPLLPRRIEIRHGHLFCGLGGGAKGFNRGQARVGHLSAEWRCLGGIDVDAAAVRDFTRLADAPGTVLDLFDRDQYVAWHGHEPPEGWTEAGPEDIRAAFGRERPHVLFLSPPCKGYSGLLSQAKSESPRYQALNRLALRGIYLALEAYKDDPVEFLLLENVPRIATRGAAFLARIEQLLLRYGYVCSRSRHDCGVLGGLGQSRERFLLVARHAEKVPPFLYEPERRSLQSVGDVLGRLPLPGDDAGGPMHAIPNLTFKTWVRLAFVEAGKDWRCLNDLDVVDGHLRDYLIVPEAWRNDTLGVTPWDETAGTVTGDARPTKGRFAVADPRAEGWGEYRQYGVKAWDQVGATVTGQKAPGQGPFSVADPRCDWHPAASRNKFKIIPWTDTARTVIGRCRAPSEGALSVCDPRIPGTRHDHHLHVNDWDQPTGAVRGRAEVTTGRYAVADPRPGIDRSAGHYLTSGHYGVTPWDGPSGAVTASTRHDSGRGNVADPRGALGGCPPEIVGLPQAGDRLACVIRALDDTWHRPFTTLELAALQDLLDPEDPALNLDGRSHSAWRERIGNAVPPGAAEAIAGVIGTTLLLAWSGQTQSIAKTPIWVRPTAAGLTLPAHPELEM